MPIYEYRCRGCGEKSSIFTKSMNSTVKVHCAHCGSRDMTRTPSTFGYTMSGKTVRETNAPPPPRFPDADYYKDPSNIGKYVEHTFEKAGMELPESTKETIAAAREGEMPKELDL